MGSYEILRDLVAARRYQLMSLGSTSTIVAAINIIISGVHCNMLHCDVLKESKLKICNIIVYIMVSICVSTMQPVTYLHIK